VLKPRKPPAWRSNRFAVRDLVTPHTVTEGEVECTSDALSAEERADGSCWRVATAH
jgi:hypothetical protein